MDGLDEEPLVTLHGDVLQAAVIVSEMDVKKVVIIDVLKLNRARDLDLLLGDGDGPGDGAE